MPEPYFRALATLMPPIPSSFVSRATAPVSNSSVRTIRASRAACSPVRNAGCSRTHLPTSSPISFTGFLESECHPKSSAPPYSDGTTTVSPGWIAFTGIMPVLALSRPHHNNTGREPSQFLSAQIGTAIASRIEGGATMTASNHLSSRSARHTTWTSSTSKASGPCKNGATPGSLSGIAAVWHHASRYAGRNGGAWLAGLNAPSTGCVLKHLSIANTPKSMVFSPFLLLDFFPSHVQVLPDRKSVVEG